MNIVLSDLESTSASPKNIVLDDLIVPPYTTSKTAEIYWRWDDEPAGDIQFLGSQVCEHTLDVPFDLLGRDIRLFMVSVTGGGVRSVSDVREAPQTVVSPNPLYGIVTHEGEVVTHEGSVVTYNG